MGMQHDDRSRAGAGSASSSLGGMAAGRSSLTQSLSAPALVSEDAAPGLLEPAAPPRALASEDRGGDDPFGLHLISADGGDAGGGGESFSVQIARPETAGGGQAQGPGGQAQGGQQQVGDGGNAGAANGNAVGPGGPQQLADIVGEALLSNLDSITATIPYAGTVSRGGGTPSGYGVTNSVPSITGLTVTPGTGTFAVAATFNLTTTWQVRSGTGPAGEVNIPDENAAAITAANYRTVASDLTPNMSDEGGRPPRTAFWAQDLTERHELRHTRHHQDEARIGLTAAVTWLRTQTASTVAEVEALVREVQNRVVRHLVATVVGTPGELVAYGDGAPSYLARANAITAKGGRGEYP